MKPACTRCDNTDLKDYASFGMDPCECRLPAPALPAPVIIGPATLYLGDAYTIRPTLGWMDADVMAPPYLIKASGGGAFRKLRDTLDKISAEGLDQGFDHTVINPLLCGTVVVFCHNDQMPKLLTYLDGSFHRFAVCFWRKLNPLPMANKHYRPEIEVYIHAWNRGYHPSGDLADKMRVVETRTRNDHDFDHPTVKPEIVMDKIIRNITGNTVCDPFMGTGSTGVATLKAGKLFVGIEKNPRHFETAIRRITQEWARIQQEAA